MPKKNKTYPEWKELFLDWDCTTVSEGMESLTVTAGDLGIPDDRDCKVVRVAVTAVAKLTPVACGFVLYNSKQTHSLVVAPKLLSSGNDQVFVLEPPGSQAFGRFTPSAPILSASKVGFRALVQVYVQMAPNTTILYKK